MINFKESDKKHLEEVNRVMCEIRQKCVVPIKSSNISLSTKEEDFKGVDYHFNIVDDLAFRVRDLNYYNSFGDITFRDHKTKNNTELERILDGFGGYYLYAWSFDSIIKYYVFFDLDLARQGIKDYLKCFGRKLTPNGDGTYFVPFPVWLFDVSKSIIHSQYDRDLRPLDKLNQDKFFKSVREYEKQTLF